jgi:hypothetical protein
MQAQRQATPSSSTGLDFTQDSPCTSLPAGGIPATGLGLVELYIALKSKPMAILYGPSDSGKLGAARTLAERLAGSGGLCLQEMVGHAWWASRSESVAMFTEAQERFNHDKIRALIEEAAEDQTAGRLFVGLLSRISPAEWFELALLAAQFRRGYIVRDPDDRPPRRLAVSPKILVIATADNLAPAPWDSNLLRMTSILSWSGHRGQGTPLSSLAAWPATEGKAFLETSVRAPRPALRRLRSLPDWRDEMLRPLLAITTAMDLQGVPDANRASSEALVYLANSWTWDGKGLFAPSFEDNLRIGLRFAVNLAMVPRLEGWPGPPQEAPDLMTAILGNRGVMEVQDAAGD